MLVFLIGCVILSIGGIPLSAELSQTKTDIKQTITSGYQSRNYRWECSDDRFYLRNGEDSAVLCPDRKFDCGKTDYGDGMCENGRKSCSIDQERKKCCVCGGGSISWEAYFY